MVRKYVKSFVKVSGALLIVGIVLFGLAIAFIRLPFHLPSDARAKRLFTDRKSDLENLVQTWTATMTSSS